VASDAVLVVIAKLCAHRHTIDRPQRHPTSIDSNRTFDGILTTQQEV
jgi:hypothetical protein